MSCKTLPDVKEYYNDRLRDFQKEQISLRKKQRYLPIIRLITFLSAGCIIYLSFKDPEWLKGSIGLLCIAGFIFAGIKDAQLKKKVRISRIYEIINKQELQAMDGDYSMFDPGKEYIDTNHPYSFDLDIFGEESLFQYLNRCKTAFGKDRLAEWLMNSFPYSQFMEERQHAVQELSGHTGFRQKLLLLFTEKEISRADKEELLSWIEKKTEMPYKSFLTVLSWVLPSMTLASLVLSILSVLPSTVFLLLFLLQLFIIALFMKRLSREHSEISGKMKILEKISESLSLIDSTLFTSSLLTEIKSRNYQNSTPAISIKKLAGLLNLLDSNLNILVAIILNGTLMFSIHILLRIEKWKLRNKHFVPAWFEVIAEFEALSSLGNFRFNNPGYSFPSRAQTGGVLFSADDLGHPLIPRDECITNAIKIEGWKHYGLITGANMSGKTTFLRTVGVNMILAMTGSPVFAKHILFTPARVYSSIRTTDSLSRRESFFYAELKRLKNITDELKAGKSIFVLLDEVFKGTNSRDKHLGTLALVKQLLSLGSSGLITTHDLAVSSLAEEFPGQVHNLCFEIHFDEDQMIIDYKLREGVSKNLNAVYLMRRMGISAEEED